MSSNQHIINKTIVKGSNIVLIGLATHKILALPFTLFVARYFGSDGYGKYSLTVSLISIIASITVCGMGMGIARFIPFCIQKESKSTVKDIVWFGFKFVGVVSVAAGLVVFFLSGWLGVRVFKDPDLVPLFKIFSLSIPLLALFQYGQGVFRGLKKWWSMVITADFLNPLLCLLGLCPLLFFNFNIDYIAVLRVATGALVLLTVLYFIFKIDYFQNVTNEKNASRRLEFLNHSYPLALLVVLKFTRNRFDILIIGFFLTSSDVGLYNSAFQLAMIMTVFLTGINRVLLPLASEMFKENRKDDLAATYKTISRWCLTGALPAFLLIWFFAEDIVVFLFGPEYQSAATCLRILAVGIGANVSLGAFGEYLQAFGESRTVLFISIVGGAINIILLCLFLKHYGKEAAAFSFSISIIVMNVIGILVLRKYKITPFSKKYFLTILIGGAIFPTLFFALKAYSANFSILAVILIFIVGNICFVCLLNTFNILTNQEKNMIRLFFNKLNLYAAFFPKH